MTRIRWRLAAGLLGVAAIAVGSGDATPQRGWRQIDMFGIRSAALQRRLARCYELIMWRELRSSRTPWLPQPGALGFAPPAQFSLTEHPARTEGEFDLTPATGLAWAHWSAILPDSARLDWIEPAQGPEHGGIEANVLLEHDTLRGRAERLSDVEWGGQPYAELVARRLSPCPEQSDAKRRNGIDERDEERR